MARCCYLLVAALFFFVLIMLPPPTVQVLRYGDPPMLLHANMDEERQMANARTMIYNRDVNGNGAASDRVKRDANAAPDAPISNAAVNLDNINNAQGNSRNITTKVSGFSFVSHFCTLLCCVGHNGRWFCFSMSNGHNVDDGGGSMCEGDGVGVRSNGHHRIRANYAQCFWCDYDSFAVTTQYYEANTFCSFYCVVCTTL